MSKYGENEQAYIKDCLFEEIKDFLKDYPISALLEIILDVIQEIESER